jgi:diguanylate cyclase (GGDEF)-like protein/PAS domain S-box-containing protein
MGSVRHHKKAALKINPPPLLQRIKIWQLWLFSVTFSVLLTEAVVSVMGLLLKGDIPPDYLLTGLVASCFAAILVVSLLSYFLEKLTESQLQLNAIIEAEPECVKLLAADGTVLQMNRAGLNIIEADSLDQVVGLPVQQLILPEYRNAFITLTKRVFEGESGNLKFELCGLKNAHCWLDMHAVPLRDSHGRITALLAVTRDITERKQAEAALRENEDAFRHLFEDSKDPILLLKEGRFIDCNTETVMQLGFRSKSELINCSPGEISPVYQPDGRHSEEKATEMIAIALREGYHRFEWLHQRADGSPLPAEVSLTPMTVNGKLIIHACWRDITERKLTEAKLKENEDAFRRLFEDSSDPILLIKDGRFIDCNTATLTQLGYQSKSEFINCRPDEISPTYQPDGQHSEEKAAEMIATALQIGYHRFEWLHTRADGSPLPVEVSLTPIKVHGELIVHVCWRDITERKRAEQQITRQLRYLNIMERISRISSTAENIEALFDGMLKEIQLIFDADRAWFLYPCDPKADFWSIPMEHTRPEWPGAFAGDMKIPVTEEVAQLFQSALETVTPLQYGPTLELTVPTIAAEEFSVKSQLQIALRPQIGSPWLLGIHHCSKAHIHDPDDLWIFTEIAQRISEALSSLISLKSLRESEEHFRLLIQKSPVAIGIANKQGGIDLLNDQFIQTFGYSLDDIPDLNAWWPLAYPDEYYRNQIKDLWNGAIEKALFDVKDIEPMEFKVTCKNGTVRDVIIFSAIVGERVLVFFDDITERKAVENKLRNRTNELALQNKILQLINQGIELPKVFNELACHIETLHPNMLCSISLLDEDGKHLRHCAAPSLPDFYNQAIDGLAIDDGVGSCGTAAYLAEGVIVENVQLHPYWEAYRELARQANLQACWSQPIKNNQGRVLGTFAIYHRLPGRPTDTEIALVDHYTELAQLAIERNQSTLQIAESLSILKATLESTGEAILAVDLNNNWLLHNQKFADLWQIPYETIAAKITAKDGNIERLYGSNQIKDPEAFSTKVTELYATPEAHSFDIIEFNDGKIVERHSIPKMINNKVVGRVWSFRDVTEQKLAEAELRIAATAFESQEGMSIADANQIILKVNKAFTHVTGYSQEEAIGHTHALLKSGRQDAHFYQTLQQRLKQDGCWEGEIWNKRKNGEIYPERLNITTVRDADNRITNYVAAFTDITKDKEAEQTIHNLAYYDPLTALPNRRLLWERLKHGIELGRRDGEQLALLMLDLDRFKTVNDSMGHLAGDELLQQAAARIKARLRDVDMIARLGGDEFVVLLEDINHPEDAARVAKAIIADLSMPFQLHQSNNTHPELNRKVIIGASIGISLFPQHGDSPETLLDNADIALYKAKDEGRGCFAYFSEAFTIIARERIALETRLRHAIEQQELRVYYQAQIDIDSGRIIGAEALVRWQDPAEGHISPTSFIPIAEETGLIVEIGAWVLRETCLQGQRWIAVGLPAITLAVNVSPHQFRRSDISSLVAKVLIETGFPAELLELELTESGLMENEDKAVEVLNNLRAQGVRLAIDDFGTGYSSLAYLKRFPLDVLKIDKSFIDDIPSLQDDMEITATIVAMGHILGFKVLAEGVETLEQLAFLREKGCDTYQGFIKSKPLPAEEFAQLLGKQI